MPASVLTPWPSCALKPSRFKLAYRVQDLGVLTALEKTTALCFLCSLVSLLCTFCTLVCQCRAILPARPEHHQVTKRVQQFVQVRFTVSRL